MSAYHFVDSDHCRPPGSIPYETTIHSHADTIRIEFELTMRQEPMRAKVCTSKEKGHLHYELN
jgi:hypothetical protein